MISSRFSTMIVTACAVVLATALGLAACSRYADIRDEIGGGIGLGPGVEAGPLPLVDSGLGSDAFPACPDRPTGDCVGSNDFLCGFEDWVIKTAKACQTLTGCKTNGWLQVKMAVDGCVAEIRMAEPNDEMVACLLTEFGVYHCPCQEEEASYYFSDDNQADCGTP